MIHGNYGYVYMIRCKVTNKLYIGQHKGKLDRKYWGSGVWIKRAIKKYGVENFERTILDCCDNQEELNRSEIAYISLYRKLWSPGLYNIADGGYRPSSYHIAALVKGAKENPPWKGVKKSDEHLRKMREGIKKYYSEHPEEGKRLGEIRKGQKRTKEQCERMSAAQTGKKKTYKNGVHHKAKKVRCIETGIIYISAADAERTTGFGRGISLNCSGYAKSCHGYHWEYV